MREDGDENYLPSPGSLSSIWLFILFILSLTSSALVCLHIICRRHTVRSSGARLVALLNFDMFMNTLFTIPYALKNSVIPYTCMLAGIVTWYSFIQIGMIMFYMLRATNMVLLEPSSKYHLDFSSKLIIATIPILVLILPLVTESYGPFYIWCGIDNIHSNTTQASGLFFCSVAWVILIAAVYELISMLNKFYLVSPEVYGLLKRKLLKGPGMYSIVTVGFYIAFDVVIIYRFVNENHMGNRSLYFTIYAEVALKYIMGIAYALIYLAEKKYLKILEEFFNRDEYFRGVMNSDGYSSDMRLSEGLLSVPSSKLSDPEDYQPAGGHSPEFTEQMKSSPELYRADERL